MGIKFLKSNFMLVVYMLTTLCLVGYLSDYFFPSLHMINHEIDVPLVFKLFAYSLIGSLFSVGYMFVIVMLFSPLMFIPFPRRKNVHSDEDYEICNYEKWKEEF